MGGHKSNLATYTTEYRSRGYHDFGIARYRREQVKCIKFIIYFYFYLLPVIHLSIPLTIKPTSHQAVMYMPFVMKANRTQKMSQRQVQWPHIDP